MKINHLKEEPRDDDWWKKVDLIASDFIRTAKTIYRPRSILSINKELIMAKERTKYTLQILSKAAEKGYKIYSLCDHGYLLDFLFSSKIAKISGLEDLKPTIELHRKDVFTDSERAVLSLIKRIQTVYPERDAFAVVLDNFFTTHRLYTELRAWGVGAFGTAKAGSGIPAELILLREAIIKEKNYSLMYNKVWEGVNYLSFVDMKATWIMTIIHDVVNQELLIKPLEKRPRAFREIIIHDDEGNPALSFSRVLDDYNKGMGGCDIHSHLISVYITSRTYYKV